MTVVPDPGLALLASPTNSDPNAGSAPDAPDTTGGAALVAHTGPAGTIADIVEMPANDQISTYVVRSGDSISDIAQMFDVSVNTIIWANNLKSAKDIHVGQTLVILPVSGLKYTVVKGDTLAGVAKKYGADAEEIAQFSGLEGAAPLVAGQVLIIPGGELAAAAPAKKTSTSKTPANPLRGASGPSIPGYYGNPLPGAILTQGLHGNNGVDLGKPSGAPILAAAAGTVIVSKADGAWNGGYGSYVVISHGNGTQTLYAHMSRDIATVGETVAKGDVIGYVGRTGEATGPHLHFEVRGAKNPIPASCAVGRACW
ncbi:MAG: M23 family metallopeptidase [bacterium]